MNEEVLGCERGAAYGRIWMRSSLLLLAVDDEGWPGCESEGGNGDASRVGYILQSGACCSDQLRQWPRQLLLNLEGGDACTLVV